MTPHRKLALVFIAGYFLGLFVGILCMTAAHAEPTEITPLKPTELERAGCPSAGFIVRCENGTAVYCEKLGSAMHYSCIDGAPVRAPPSSEHTWPGATPPATVAPHVRREPHHPRHRAHVRTLFDLLFRGRR